MKVSQHKEYVCTCLTWTRLKLLQMYMYQLALSESNEPVKFYNTMKHFIEYSMSCSNIKVKTELFKEF